MVFDTDQRANQEHAFPNLKGKEYLIERAYWIRVDGSPIGVPYAPFEKDVLRLLDVANWAEVLRERRRRQPSSRPAIELGVVKTAIDRAKRLVETRKRQRDDPDLSDVVVKEYNSQIVENQGKLATLEEQRNRLEGLIAFESVASERLHKPENCWPN